ncbi:hypothetical protein KIN20_030506 [Parelaphostrongylus tenuis]|uniref:Uncharacterized protein n=1 Tax=Parelaphostrongylus tenuis TaxID=148309 RepID=A0AAD5WG62_PARTN|nr:hypothetical protein KIN20_030506 [Parelaphostrongylus tenuis]
MVTSCIIVGSTVTGICPAMNPANNMCQNVATAIDAGHLTLTGTLTVWTVFLSSQFRIIELRTSSWLIGPRSMWQNVVDRALRLLRSGPFGSHLYTVTVTVN